TGVRKGEAKTLLDPIRELTLEPVWSEERKGLIVLRSPDRFQVFYSPQPLRDVIEIGKRFQITPILPILDRDRTFYILALDQKHIRLIRCNESESQEVPLPPKTPTSLLEDALTSPPDHDLMNKGTGAPSTGPMNGQMFT